MQKTRASRKAEELEYTERGRRHKLADQPTVSEAARTTAPTDTADVTNAFCGAGEQEQAEARGGAEMPNTPARKQKGKAIDDKGQMQENSTRKEGANEAVPPGKKSSQGSRPS